jgi:HEAT repeat protein
MSIILDEYDYRNMPPRKRLDKLSRIIKTEKRDESKRWDAVWLAGEILDDKKNEKYAQEIANLMVWVLIHEKNGIVKHEAAFQIGLRNFRDKIQDLKLCAVYDSSDIARHEAIEAIGMMRVQDDDTKRVLTGLTFVDNKAVSETAKFVLKRLERLKDKGEYRGEAIV